MELGLFAAAFLFFAAFAPMGHLPSDTQYSIATAESIVYRGSLAVGQSPMLPYLKEGRNGNYYSKYGIGYALLFVPSVILAGVLKFALPHSLQSFATEAVVSFTNTFLAAVLITMTYSLFTVLGYKKKLSLFCVALIAAGSLLLPYSKIIHAETPTALLLIFFLLIAARIDDLDIGMGSLLGLLLSALITIKAANAVSGLIIAGLVLFLFIRRKATRGAFAAFLAGAVSGAILILVLNQYRFGDPFNTGYGGEQSNFSTSLVHGLWGLLLSPSKSALLFSPLLIVAILGAGAFWKRNLKIGILATALAVINFLFYAKWHDWPGGWAWGPRLVMPAIIVIHVFLPESIVLFRKKPAYRVLLTLCILGGLSISLLGSIIWYQQICYFHRDYNTVRHSHPIIAARLLSHKLKGLPEIYAPGDLGWNSRVRSDFQSWPHLVSGDSLDLTTFEKFRGFSTMWSGVYHNFGIRAISFLPFVLVAAAILIFFLLWKKAGTESSHLSAAKTAER